MDGSQMSYKWDTSESQMGHISVTFKYKHFSSFFPDVLIADSHNEYEK